MGINLPRVVSTKTVLKRLLSLQESTKVPKGHLAVYIGESEKKRCTVPISYLKHPSFKYLLDQAEEEFGYNHSMGGLTIPCSIDAFDDLLLSLQ